MGRSYTFVSSSQAYLDYCHREMAKLACRYRRSVREFSFTRRDGKLSLNMTVCGKEVSEITDLAEALQNAES
jgi:hypothetical protein